MFLYWVWNWSHQKDDRLTLIVHLITSIHIVNIFINILLRFDVNFNFALVVHKYIVNEYFVIFFILSYVPNSVPLSA